MKVRVRNCYTYIDSITDRELMALSQLCSYRSASAQYSPAYKNGHWDGRVRFLDTDGMRFPTGMLSSVKKQFKKVEVIDERKPPEKLEVPKWEFPHELRDYQVDIVKDAMKFHRGTISAATGAGKTIIAYRIAFEAKVKTLFIVNTDEALSDTLDKARECFPNAHQDDITEYSGKRKKIGRFITVATMGALVYELSRSKSKKTTPFFRQGFGMFFADEVHHAGSVTWSNVLLDTNAYYRFGLTGTPFRTDGAKVLLWATIGKIITEVKTKFLQDQGHLAKSRIVFVEVEHPNELSRPLVYAEAYDQGIVNNQYRNHLAVSLVKKHLDQVKLIIVEREAHGDLILEEVLKIDPTAVFIKGKTKGRRGLKHDFTHGDLRTVIATKIYNESADIPRLQVVINLSGMKSGITMIQRLGRVIRNHHSKDVGYFYDFMDVFNKKLLEHSRERVKILIGEGHDIWYAEVEDSDSLYQQVTGKKVKKRTCLADMFGI